MSLFAETPQIFDLRGGNIDYLSANRVILQAIIDKLEEIYGYTYNHDPFDCDLYWTSLTDSNSVISGTSIPEFTTQLKTLLIEARSDLETLLVSVRQNKYGRDSNNTTNYSDIMKSACIIMDQALKQYSNYIKLVLTPYTDHDSNDISSLFSVDSNVFSTSMTAVEAVKAAVADGSIVDHARYYFSEADSNTFYRKSHIGNMNMQSLRTFKRIVNGMGDVWPRASVVLAAMNGKYAGSDMSGSSSPVQSLSTEFSEYLNYLGSLGAVAAYLSVQIDEYVEASRSSTDGDINYTTAFVKSAIDGFSKYFDGDTSTVDSNTPITDDLVQKMKDITAYLVQGSFDPESVSDYTFRTNAGLS